MPNVKQCVVFVGSLIYTKFCFIINSWKVGTVSIILFKSDLDVTSNFMLLHF